LQQARAEVSLGIQAADDTAYVTVFQARVLPGKAMTPINPCCSVRLLLENCDGDLQATSVKSDTLNPAWHETLEFHGVSCASLPSLALSVAVYDRDRFGGKTLLGEKTLRFAEMDLPLEPTWFRLQGPNEF